MPIQSKGSNFFAPTRNANSDYIALTDQLGYPLLIRGTSVPVAGSYAKGAIYMLTTGASGARSIYENIGTTTTPLFHSVGLKSVMAASATIATTGNTDAYIIAPQTSSISSIDFSGVDALAASDSNYITWTVTNLGQAGAGSLAALATTPAGINTTKVTGGTAISANTRYTFTLSGTASNLVVAAGDRIRIRAAVTGTLANTVTFPSYIVRF